MSDDKKSYVYIDDTLVNIDTGTIIENHNLIAVSSIHYNDLKQQIADMKAALREIVVLSTEDAIILTAKNALGEIGDSDE